MTTSTVTAVTAPTIASMEAAIEAACGRIAPVWPLDSFVAVNPFAGVTALPFTEAASLLERATHRSILMDSQYYLARIAEGRIRAGDIEAALGREGISKVTRDPVGWLSAGLRQEAKSSHVLTVADFVDRSAGSNWAATVRDEISKWCSSYFDHGQSAWRMPWRDLPLYSAWKQAAELDANPEILGLRNFRFHVAVMPSSATEATEQALEALGVGPDLATDFLHRQLLSVNGWSAYCACIDRFGSGGNLLRDLLAIRLAYDTALHLCTGSTGRFRLTGDAGRESRDMAMVQNVAQRAVEHAWRGSLLKRLRRSAAAGAVRPALQAVFCIDVRSEVYRRALEEQSPDIETVGFAGFFGMSLEVEGAALCPVLLSPNHRVGVSDEPGVAAGAFRNAKAAWNSLKQSATACFSAVEVGGLWSAVDLFRKSLGKTGAEGKPAKLVWNIPVAERVRLAAGALKNMSLDPSRLAPVVLICGHGSRTENNPYEASLDCGACGGHKGDVNARFAAAILNDADVRRELANLGVSIPEDTVFVAGLHITTTDEVVLFDSVLREDQRTQLVNWLDAAGQKARAERGGGGDAQRRSRDWSEVRPEWGLAGNAAFIAAPRALTRGVNLEGRAFLHDYDAARDTDGSVLTLILTAPVIVASWINLQYYGSVVNNEMFGSGNKALHNVVGQFGIWEGNAGDLRTGLPMQSLHDGLKWMHEPLRLQVMIAATRRSVDAVLDAQPSIRELVDNGWIDLVVLEGEKTWHCWRTRTWRELAVQEEAGNATASVI